MSKMVIYGYRLLFLLCSMLCLNVVHAQSADPKLLECRAEATASEGLKVRQAKFDFELSPRLEDLLQKSIPLYFTTEFNLKRTRRYWWDEPVINVDYSWRLNYHTLTRKYRLARNNIHYSFSTLNEALALIKVVRNWTITDSLMIDKNSRYVASIRFHLDETKLPKLLLATPLTSVDWLLDSGWRACSLKTVGD